MKQTLISILLLCTSFFVRASTITVPPCTFEKSFVLLEDNKAPYRLLLSNIQHTELDNQIVVTFNAINMGSESLVFGINNEIPEKLILEFEESFNRNVLLPYKEDIRLELLKTNIEILSGKMVKNIELMVEKNKHLAKVDVGRSYNSKLFVKKKKFNSKIRKKSKPSPKTEVAEASPTPPKTSMQETEVIVDVAAQPLAAPSPEAATSSLKKPKRTKKRKVKQEEKESVSFTNKIEDEPAESDFYDDDNCADIVIDSIIVLKNRGNRSITLQYTITNKGNRKADLYGVTGDDSDNLALKAFLASSPNLSRGSLPLGGAFIHNGLEKGLLYPNQSFTNTIKLDIRKKTKFTSYIILNLDPFNTMIECDKTNNNGHLFLE